MDDNGESTRRISAIDSETFGQDTSFHLDQPVGSMSISPSGRDVVLASKEGLHIIDLDSPYSPPRYLQHRTSWEVADVQWSPFAARDYWVVSTSNQKALVWNLGMSPASGPIEYILHGHTRAITDINFSAHNADVLATCAVDSFVHCWDLRVPSRPVNSFSDWFAGATQVKWSRQDPHVVASSHDKFLHIWDDRKGAYPVRSIEAHGTKIYGVDWNRFHPNKIATCSLDKTIKFWDVDNPEDVPERVINTPFPVWRARHTPFGWGVLAMPQRGNSDLHLYDRRPKGSKADEADQGKAATVADFPGHKGQVKEFLWRVRGPTIDGIDHRDFQLISWGTDRELRLHHIEPETLEAVGYEKGVNEIHRLNFTRRGARYKTFRDEPPDLKYGDVFESGATPSTTPGQTFQLRPRGSTSVGMSKVPIPHSKGWVQGRTTDSRIGMHGRAGDRQVTNPISWMKNVKITTWDQDSLAEEITQVGARFTKVDFEKVDVRAKKTTISLQAPWAEEFESLYMRVEMQFPKGYPREGIVDFKVQKTASMTEELVNQLSTELHTIAETYSTKKRGCIEAVLRYLLREQDMEQIVSLVLEEPLAQSDMLNDVDTPGELSSDDDDDHSGAFQGPPDLLRSSELNTNVMVPVAKACGALWSETGKLVCFFPPKAKESSIVMDSLAKVDPNATRAHKLFEGFGRLQARSPALRTATGTVTTEDDARSDTSETSYVSISSSSASSDVMASLPTAFLPSQAWRGAELGLHRSRSTDRSNKSTTGFGNIKSAVNTPANVVSIHFLPGILPSQSDLALEYKVFGSGSYICDHNAEVAKRHGKQDVADVWKLIQLILRNEVPLECTSGLLKGRDIITVSQSAFHALRRKDSGVDLSHDAVVQSKSTTTHGRIRWGGSSFGSGHLISAIFDHFEQLGDVQMLALLSCVLAEPRAANPNVASTSQEPHSLPLPLRCPAFSIDYYPSLEVAQHMLSELPMETRASTKSKLAIASAAVSDQSSQPSTSVDAVGNGSDPTGTTPPFQSVVSSHSRRSSRPFTSDHKGLQDHDGVSQRSAAASLSTSPEESRLTQRSNSGLPFSFSRASLTAFAQSYSSSPPINNISGNNSDPVKRASPSGSIDTSRLNTSRGYANPRGSRTDQFSGGRQADASLKAHLFPSASTLSSRSNYGDGGRTPDSRVRTNPSKSGSAATNGKRKAKMKSSLHNQNKFDNDGYASVPLLDPELEWKFKTYRSSYAYLLGAWQLHTQMAEILKFDGLTSYFASPKSVKPPSNERANSEFAWSNANRRETITNMSRAATEKRGLELRRRCPKCSEPLKAIEKNGVPIGWHCASASCSAARPKPSIRSICVICEKVVSGLMIPCLQCNHVTCFACAGGWFGDASKTGAAARRNSNKSENADDKVNEHDEDDLAIDHGICPSGCGCQCLSVGSVTIPYPKSIASETEDQVLIDDCKKPRTDRLMSQHGPDTAIRAFLSLTRTRSISAAKESVMRTQSINESAIDDNDWINGPDDKESDPWAGSRYAALGRGIGGGLSRGLRNKASDVTIKKLGNSG